MQHKRPEPFPDEEKGAGGENKEYNSVNEEYRRLFLERLNRTQPGTAQERTIAEEEKKVNEPLAEKPLQEKEEKNATRYYINKLRVYPKEEYRDYMRSFREYL